MNSWLSWPRRLMRRIRHEILWHSHLWCPVGRPKYGGDAPQAEESCFSPADGAKRWYPPPLVAPSVVGERSCTRQCAEEVLAVMRKLDPDEYVRYLIEYYEAGLARIADWRYSDITTVLLAATQLLRPRNYLEIGVRRGRSMAMVASAQPECDIVGFDMWMEDYAGMENPGPAFVRAELAKLGFRGKVELVSGNSHQTVKRYLQQHPRAYFDLIAVDGDHSRRGASLDLRDVLHRLKIGGMIAFDDIVHPQTAFLSEVWRQYVADDPRFSTWSFGELGYGIALGMRRF